MTKRCDWAGSEPLYLAYHDQEWGVPVHDDRHLFEMLILEGAQAGLSWSTILKKREGYRLAFENFEPEKVAAFNEDAIEFCECRPNLAHSMPTSGSSLAANRSKTAGAAWLKSRPKHPSLWP